MFEGTTRQLIIFALASVVAFYQLNKSRMVIERTQNQAHVQLQKAQAHIVKVAQKNGTQLQFFFVDEARFKNQKTLLVIIPANEQHAPIIGGELYMDPAAVRSAQKPKDPRYKYRSNGRHGHNARSKNGRRKSTGSILVFKVHDARLHELAAKMFETGLISRVVQGKHLAWTHQKDDSLERKHEDEDFANNKNKQAMKDIREGLNPLTQRRESQNTEAVPSSIMYRENQELYSDSEIGSISEAEAFQNALDNACDPLASCPEIPVL